MDQSDKPPDGVEVQLTALLHKENEARAKAFLAEKRGDDEAARRWAGVRRQVMTERVALLTRAAADPVAAGHRMQLLATRHALADERERVARAEGRSADADHAQREVWDILAEVQVEKGRVADLLLRGLRSAVELFPERLDVVLLTVPVLGLLAERLLAVEARQDELEAAVLELAEGQGVLA